MIQVTRDFKVNRLLMVINTKRTRGPAFYKNHDAKGRKTILLSVAIIKNKQEKAPEKNIFAQSFSM